METKTNANATFATKTALTALQNAVKPAIASISITGKTNSVEVATTALDQATTSIANIPTVTSSTAGIVTPAMKAQWDAGGGSGGSWENITSTSNIDLQNVNIGTQISISGPITTLEGVEISDSDIWAICTYKNSVDDNVTCFFSMTGFIESYDDTTVTLVYELILTLSGSKLKGLSVNDSTVALYEGSDILGSFDGYIKY